MKRYSLFAFVLLMVGSAAAQVVPIATGMQILKAEDARRYDVALEKLLKDRNLAVRERAALAAGRIGDERAVPALAALLENDSSNDVRAMAAFAIGEVESIKGAEVILKVLKEGYRAPAIVQARAVEAAGKIAAANPKDPKAKELGTAIVSCLKNQWASPMPTDSNVARLGLTAALRARPEGADAVVKPFLADTEPGVVADALNTLARLRAKNANRDARDLLATNVHAVVRANAARVLGAAEDKDALDVLLKAATTDTDSRVRVSAIRSLASLKDGKGADGLLDRGESLLVDYKRSKYKNPVETNEMLEISAALGRMLTGTNNPRVLALLNEFEQSDNFRSTEIVIGALRIGPKKREGKSKLPEPKTWRQFSTMAQFLGEMAKIETSDEDLKKAKTEAPEQLRNLANAFLDTDSRTGPEFIKATPDVLRAFAQYRPDDLDEVLRKALRHDDVIVRATAAELIAEQPKVPGTITVLERAFTKAVATDKHDNDAVLAILDAMAKVDPALSVDTFYKALDSPDYLVRKKAFELISAPKVLAKYPGAVAVAENARSQHKDHVFPYDSKTGTKLGQVLNADSDYRRALSRKNGTVKAVLTTEKGTFTVDFTPEEAPLTVDNFIKLARSGYFNGLEVHRVVPNFVMQDGDPRGDGNGGPGWSIRCEVNMLPYDRGAVGMALSGKDTGGSQWFVTHSPQPHLDGGYTVFGHVNETGMKVVDNIVRGDKILSVKIVEAVSEQRSHGTQRKKR